MTLDILSIYKYDKKLENFVPRQVADDRENILTRDLYSKRLIRFYALRSAIL